MVDWRLVAAQLAATLAGTRVALDRTLNLDDSRPNESLEEAKRIIRKTLRNDAPGREFHGCCGTCGRTYAEDADPGRSMRELLAAMANRLQEAERLLQVRTQSAGDAPGVVSLFRRDHEGN